MSKTKRIVVGSTNQLKIGAVRKALLLARIKARVIPFAVTSKVNAQPVGFGETFEGALHRAIAARKENPDCITIGIENGILSHQLAPAMERFIMRGDGVHVDIAVIVIMTQSGFVRIATSAGVEFPGTCVKVAEGEGFDKITAGMILTRMHGTDPQDPHSFLLGSASRPDLKGTRARQRILTEILRPLLRQIG